VNVLGLDTATPSSAVALACADGWLREARDDVAAGERPRHAQRLLALAAELLAGAGIGWDAVGCVAVGVGPGGYTGLRIGLATAHGIALAHGAQLVGVGTLRALAEPVRERAGVAVLDARRGEAFVAAYRDGQELIAPCVCRPQAATRWRWATGRYDFGSSSSAAACASRTRRVTCTGSARGRSADSLRAGASRPRSRITCGSRMRSSR
jgi:tRNA threonylcarbamoyladenosine biosynthesis protein TsaB